MTSKKTIGLLSGLLGAILILLSTGLAQAQTTPAVGGNVIFTVTAVSKKDTVPPISKDDVQLSFGKEKKQIGDWKKGDSLFLTILIDDSIDSTAAGQWQYLKEFIMSQSPATQIAVGYLRNNSTMVVQDFTPDHELAAKALRIPIGGSALGSSPYLSTMDMLKRWPATGPRRSVILITSGIDYFRGSGFGTFSPDLDPLIQRAERQNTNIWTIYFPSAGHRGRAFYQVNNAQNNIDKLSEETGAESYFLGTGVPVSIKPYLDEINTHLSNQYLLSLVGSGGTKGKYQSVKLRTELQDVEFFAPSAIYLPGTGK
jgi:hypothetical protein